MHYDVLVIGGGVIGVTSAFSLAERGVQVGLLERSEICSGASHGNAGWLFPSHSSPLPAPGAIRQGLRWLADRDSPFYIRPRPSLALLRWLWQFRAACTERAARRTFRLNRELSLRSLERYAELAKLPGLEFGFSQRGLILAYRSAEALHEGEEEVALLESLGGRAERLDAEALRARVPAVSLELVGGHCFPPDGHLTPADFVHGLAREAERRGAELRTGTEVLEVSLRPGRPTRLWTTRGHFSCDELVLAAGAWSAPLGRQLGLRVPVESAKGYSITMRRPPEFGEVPVMLTEAKVGVTPMGPNLRFAGTLELAGIDLSLNARRVRAIERAVREYLPGLPRSEPTETWRGLRPLTPDDLPLIGRPSRVPGVVLATGHGMSGMSQGPMTGELVAAIVTGEPPPMELAPFSPDRFT